MTVPLSENVSSPTRILAHKSIEHQPGIFCKDVPKVLQRVLSNKENHNDDRNIHKNSEVFISDMTFDNTSESRGSGQVGGNFWST